MPRRTEPNLDRLIMIPTVSQEPTQDPFGHTEAAEPDYNNPRRIWAARMPVPITDQFDATSRRLIQILYARWLVRGSDQALLEVGDGFRDDQGDEWQVEGKQEINRRRYYELYCKHLA